ncbi:MAG: PKD domain-containing protein [Bacteroidetes bacterium]|nr:PKD domain-containing protein [Bacteroidota bacterium]
MRNLKITLSGLALIVSQFANAQCPQGKLKISGPLSSDHELTCTQRSLDFYNVSNISADSLQSFRWDYGDGTVITGTSGSNIVYWTSIPSHQYTSEGEYFAEFTVVFKNGLKDTSKMSVMVMDEFPLYVMESVDCSTEYFHVRCSLQDKPEYAFFANSLKWSGTGFLKYENINQSPTPLLTNSPGNKSMTATHQTLNKLGCPNLKGSWTGSGTQMIARINSSTTKIDPFEQYQCDADKTIHFTNSSFYNTTQSIERLWDFGDVYAEQCTTDTRNNINVGSNCNFSKDSLPAHTYQKTDSVYYKYYYLPNKAIHEYYDSNGVLAMKTIDTSNKTEHRSLFEKYELRSYRATISLYNPTQQCSVADTAFIVLSPPVAENLKFFEMFRSGNGKQKDGARWVEMNLEINKNQVPAYLYNFDLGGYASGDPSSDDMVAAPFSSTFARFQKDFTNTNPDAIYLEFQREKISSDHIFHSGRGSNLLDIAVTASHGDDGSGNLRCPVSTQYKNVSTAYISEPDFTLVSDPYLLTTGQDSVLIRFKNIQQRPHILLISRGDGGDLSSVQSNVYVEYMSDFEPDPTGSRSYASVLTGLTFEYNPLSTDYTEKQDTVFQKVTSRYNALPALRWNILPDEITRRIVRLNLDLSMPDHLILSAMGGTGSLIDTTGFSVKIQKAIYLIPTDYVTVDADDSMLTGIDGKGLYKIKFTLPGKSLCGVSFDNASGNIGGDQIISQMASGNRFRAQFGSLDEYYQNTLYGIQFAQLQNPYFAYPDYFKFVANNTSFGQHDTIKILTNAFYPDYTAFAKFDSDRNDAAKSHSNPLSKNSVYVNVDGKSVSMSGNNMEPLLSKNNNWYSQIKKGGTEKIYIDWDIDNGVDESANPDYWRDADSMAVFMKIPTKPGSFKGFIKTKNAWGVMGYTPFYYKVFAADTAELIRNAKSGWSILPQCSHQIVIKDSSKIGKTDRCGNSLTINDQLQEIKYLWGDGDSTVGVPGDSFSHIYSNGNYTLKALYYSKYGQFFEYTEPFTIDSVIRDFAFSYYLNNDTIHTQGPAIGDSLSRMWKFGDGGTDTSQSASHIYSGNGSKQLCLEITDNNSGCKLSRCETVNVGGCNAYFEAVKDTFTSFTIWIVEKSTGSNLKYKWDFGDGSTSNTQFPQHHYNQFGLHEICLEVTNQNCRSVYCDAVGMDSTGKLLKQEGYDIEVVTPDKLGIEDLGNSAAFKLYPNPAHSGFVFEQPTGLTVSELILLDVQGKIIREFKLNNSHEFLNLGDVAPGMYVVRFNTGSENRYVRLMVE